MKADISADTFRPQRHFTTVVVGQGQVLLDSALNEQGEITRYRSETAAADVIGGSGVPKQTGGFGVSVAPDGADLLVEPGRMYVAGILCENDPAAVGATVASLGAGSVGITVDSAASGGVPFAIGQWVDIASSTTTRARVGAVNGNTLTIAAAVAGVAVGDRLLVTPVMSLRHQPDRLTFDPFAAGAPDRVVAGAYRVELDVWPRHLSAVEDPAIREVALGDAESSTRVRSVWQVRLVAAGAVGGGSCATSILPSRGTLAASTAPGLVSDDPCVLPDEAGYRGLENQLYRVEVHSATPTQVVLKWQRDNASTVSKVLSLGSTLALEDMGRDDERGFATAPYVEVTDDYLELEQLPSDLIAVTGGTDSAQRQLVLSSAPTKAQLARNARARRWDGVITVEPTSPTAGDPVALERGVQVALGAGALRPGDYWLIPGRTSNSAGGGTISWPHDDSGDPIPQAPQGIAHRTTGLAVVDTSNTAFLGAPTNLRECRTLFPPLTAITAADVSVDPTPCDFGTEVKTVQDAIDELCRRREDCCALTAVPGPGWESVFGKIAAGADARICFPLGTYPTPRTVSVSGKGHLVLHGQGAGSVLTGTGTSPILSFASCAGVSVDSLSVVAAANSAGGALTFTQCGDVVVTDCRFTVGAAAVKQSSGLRASGGTLTVSSSTFSVGNLQMGLVAVDSARTVVRDCRFQVVPLPASATSGAITTATTLERIQARRLLVSGLTPTAAAGGRVGVTVGRLAMSFGTPSLVVPTWGRVVAPSYPTMRHFQKALDKLLRSIFAGGAPADAAPIASFVADRIIGRRTATMSQAVVVAGRTVGDVRIEDNDISAAVQGIHIGVSHRGQPRSGPADVAGRVSIRGNKVAVLVPAEGARARHAIFVGNADRLRLVENDASFINQCEADPVGSDGIRIHGFLGRAITMRDNVVDGFPGGITLSLFQARGSGQAALTRMWAVEDNLISGAATPITLAGPLKSFVRFRGNKPGPADN